MLIKLVRLKSFIGRDDPPGLNFTYQKLIFNYFYFLKKYPENLDVFPGVIYCISGEPTWPTARIYMLMV